MAAPCAPRCDAFSAQPFLPFMTTAPSAAERLFRSLPLDALRGFDAAARLSSFTAAAEELSLTQSAVSKQVKALEDLIGKALFTRGPRGLQLTAEGRALHQAARDTFARLQLALEQVVQSPRSQVAVTVTPSFASLWLVPRLAAYRALAPQVDIRVDAAEAELPLERAGIDLAVRLCPLARAERSWTLLAQERLMLVAAPALARRVATPGDLAALPLLVFAHGSAQHAGMSWQHWHDRLGLPHTASQPVFQFSQYEHLVKAAIDGMGVAIGRTPLVLPLLRSGQLEVLLPESSAGPDHPGLGYHLVWSQRSRERPEVQHFAAWVERELAADVLG